MKLEATKEPLRLLCSHPSQQCMAYLYSCTIIIFMCHSMNPWRDFDGSLQRDQHVWLGRQRNGSNNLVSKQLSRLDPELDPWSQICWLPYNNVAHQTFNWEFFCSLTSNLPCFIVPTTSITTVNIWCAHTTNPNNSIDIMAYTVLLLFQ